MSMKRIKSGDLVKVTTGKSKGNIGKVLKVLGDHLLVEGCQLVKKHIKPNPQTDENGGIRTQESPIHVSNVAMYNAEEKQISKIGFKYIEKENGTKQKVRYFKSNNELVDLI